MSSENKVLGTVGAVVGCFLGIVVWCLIGKLGYISWIGGFAISGLAFLGYYLLGKDFSKYAFAVVVALVVVSVYLATRLNYAIALYDAFKEEGLTGSYGLGDCFSNVMDWLALVGETSSFYVDLALGYVFTVVAGISVFKKVIR